MTTTTTDIEMIGHREFLAMAYALIDAHLPGWKFQWDTSVRRLAACHHADRKITASRALTESISRRQAFDTLTHEIAHALVGAPIRPDRRRQRNGAPWEAKRVGRDRGANLHHPGRRGDRGPGAVRGDLWL